MAIIKKSALFLLAVVACVGTANADRSMQPIAGDPIETNSGRISGTMIGNDVRAYLGIPYATPPVGNLRWAAPKPNSWTGIYNADHKGSECMQVLRPHNINHYFGEESVSEDCLYLNLWSPKSASASSKLPVIVFIHGGGFTIGSSAMPIYDGEAMARAGAVFVNLNYRVGALGFMAHPELSAERGGHSGNYGLMDQNLALQWVHDNIARFGGDPDKVLIMGQSAGAGSVIAQLFNPQAKGLFRAAVMSSGCNFTSDGTALANAEKTGLQIQERLHAGSLDDMRQIAADRILALQSENQLGLKVDGIRLSGPVIDGAIYPAKRSDLMAKGAVNAVPLIASFNANDISFGFEKLLMAKTIAEYQAAATDLYGADAKTFLALYPAKSDGEVQSVARLAATEGGLELNARVCGQMAAAQGIKTYINEYSRVHPYTPGVKIADQNIATVGAYHTADIPYWFGTQDAFNRLRQTRNWTAWDRTLSAQMMAALIHFADTGNPDTKAMPWAAWNPKMESKIDFGDSVKTIPLATKRLDWMAAHRPASQPITLPRAANPRD